MVQVMTICREWLEIIDGNKSLWRGLILPEKQGVWRPYKPSVVELFDRKSGSTLKEVEMQIDLKSREEVDTFHELLQKSKESLRTLYLKGPNPNIDALLSHSSWMLPNLSDCRINDGRSFVTLTEIKGMEGNPKTKDSDNFKSSANELRLLWINNEFALEEVLEQAPHRCSRLVSLSLQARIKPLAIVPILQGSSQTLKHLAINLNHHGGEAQQPAMTFQFPLLQVLEIELWLLIFPSWISIPPTCTVISRSQHVITDLPPTSNLWLDSLQHVEDLAISRNPNLVGMRIITFDTLFLRKKAIDEFNLMLRERKDNVEAGMEIEGVKMVHLKRLVFPFKHLNQYQLLQLRELVDEVVELTSAERIIEVEVDV